MLGEHLHDSNPVKLYGNCRLIKKNMVACGLGFKSTCNLVFNRKFKQLNGTVGSVLPFNSFDTTTSIECFARLG